MLSNQYATMDTVADFPSEIAPARTFVFVREVEPLITAGLIKGGDLDNAIVIYDSPMEQAEMDRIADMMNVPTRNVAEFGFINAKPLSSPNEPARHKLLDLVGDIALIGRPLKGEL